MSDSLKACEGGRTITVSTGTNDYHKCLHCGQLWSWKNFSGIDCEYMGEEKLSEST